MARYKAATVKRWRTLARQAQALKRQETALRSRVAAAESLVDAARKQLALQQTELVSEEQLYRLRKILAVVLTDEQARIPDDIRTEIDAAMYFGRTDRPINFGRLH